MQKRSHCCLHHPMKILATGLTHPLCPAMGLIYIQPEVPGNGKNPSAMQSKKVVKVQKKPSKTRQRNSCHKLHPTMSNIHTGDALMKLCSKVSVKRKTSLTQNQTLDFRTNMDLFWGTETSRHTKGLLQNSLLCPKSIFMAKFRHSKAQTEELEAILKTTGKAQLRLLTKTEKRTKAEMAQLRKLNVEPGSSAEMKCSWTRVLCTEPWSGLDGPLRLSWTKHRGPPEKLLRFSWDISLLWKLNLAEHTGFHLTRCWTFLMRKSNVREEGILQCWTMQRAEGKRLWCTLAHQHVGFYNAHTMQWGWTLTAR